MSRDRWSSRTIFLFAAIGSAVGLGNIWRFPYLTYKFGGGAFLIPYLIVLFALGIPLLILEFALGQKMQKGAFHAFKGVHHKLSGIGISAILAGFVVVVYYAAVMAWSLVFLINSFSAKVPWSDDAKGFFFGNVLQISDSVANFGGINVTLLISLFVVWCAIYLCVRNGVKSVGKVVAITMPLPLLLLGVLFIRGITLPGAFEGIAYYLTPNFSLIFSSEIWIAAISQIFFTLSLAFGIMIAYASFNKESQDLIGDGYITAITNSAISLFAGFVVFSVIGYMSFVQGVGVEEVATAGPGLAFVVFPQALSLMPLAPFFSVLFFIVLLTLGIDSAFSLVEAVNTSIGDNFDRPNRKFIAQVVCTVAFLLGIIFVTGAGLYILDIVDHYVTNYTLVIVGIFECVAIGWVYGAEKMRAFINSTSRYKVGYWWTVMIKYIIPVLLVIFLATQLYTDLLTPYEGYPMWAQLIGWSAVIIPVGIAILVSMNSKKK